MGNLAVELRNAQRVGRVRRVGNEAVVYPFPGMSIEDLRQLKLASERYACVLPKMGLYCFGAWAVVIEDSIPAMQKDRFNRVQIREQATAMAATLQSIRSRYQGHRA